METRKYPSQSELESWREAARQHIVSLAQQTDAEVHAYIHQLIQTVTAYEAREGWMVSSPESIERYLTRPLLTIDYDNPLWREQFLHAPREQRFKSAVVHQEEESHGGGLCRTKGSRIERD